MQVEKCYDVLIKTVKFFDDNNIRYWLHAGTLLGLYRDKQLIEYDTDIDLGMYDSDATASNFKHKFQQHMNSISMYLLKQDVSRHKYESQNRKIGVDLFFFKKAPKFYYHEAYQGCMSFPFECIDKQDKLIIGEQTFSIPMYVETFLANMYGSTWNIKNSEFHKPKEYKNFYSKKEKLFNEEL